MKTKTKTLIEDSEEIINGNFNELERIRQSLLHILAKIQTTHFKEFGIGSTSRFDERLKKMLGTLQGHLLSCCDDIKSVTGGKSINTKDAISIIKHFFNEYEKEKYDKMKNKGDLYE